MIPPHYSGSGALAHLCKPPTSLHALLSFVSVVSFVVNRLFGYSNMHCQSPLPRRAVVEDLVADSPFA